MCQGTATPMTDYWRNVANAGRGSSMTKALHDACDEVARLESDRAALVEMVSALIADVTDEDHRANDWSEQVTIRNARALLARMEADK